MLLLLACATLPLTGGSDTAPDAADFDWTADEQTIHDLVNAHRVGLGLGELSLDGAIGPPTRGHSDDMLSGDVAFSHDGFEDRVAEIEGGIDLVGAGENVGYVQGYDEPAEALVAGWLQSPGHRENIEGDWDLTGVGIAADGSTVYATQIFVKSR